MEGLVAFQRWQSWYRTSRAFTRFKEHHTEINNHYWSLAPIGSYGKYLQRHSAPDTLTSALFHASGPNARRLEPLAEGWAKNFKEFENWTRLSALLSGLSYLETYISTAVTLALRSDPLLRFGQSRAIDGIAWIKRSVGDDVSELVTGCVKGEWPKRLASYQKLFGTVPSQLTALGGNLDRMRNVRNGVAHSFGRDLNLFEDPLRLATDRAERLSESTLLRWLGDIEQAASTVDEHLLHSHLGDFELLWHFHRWRDLPRSEKEPRFVEATAFSRFLGRTFGSAPGRDYCRQIERYYDQA